MKSLFLLTATIYALPCIFGFTPSPLTETKIITTTTKQRESLLKHSLSSKPLNGETQPSSTPPPKISKDEHIAILDRSLQQHTTIGILDRVQNILAAGGSSIKITSLSEVHASLRFALISHGKDEGTIDGALHNYANFGGLAAYRTNMNLFTQIPARRMARVGSQQQELEDSLQLLRSREGGKEVLENYNAFRCTKDLDIFYIRQGLVRRTISHNSFYFSDVIFHRKYFACNVCF